MADREHYGIDAPTVVRNLGLAGAALIACVLLPDTMPGASLAHALWQAGIFMLAAAEWMLVSSLWIKKIVMRSLLGRGRWRGDEQVLEQVLYVSCGLGLVAIGAAHRVPCGIVHGIDLWQAADLSGNRPEALRANAAAAGVEHRLAVDTGDARALPYADAGLDVVASMTAIHDIPQRAGRRTAIAKGVAGGAAGRTDPGLRHPPRAVVFLPAARSWCRRHARAWPDLAPGAARLALGRDQAGRMSTRNRTRADPPANPFHPGYVPVKRSCTTGTL